MNKRLRNKVIVGSLISLVAVAACVLIIFATVKVTVVKDPIVETELLDTPGVGQGYIDAEVLEKHDDHIVVECTKGYLQEVSVGDRLKASLNTVSDEPVPVVQEGDRVRILYMSPSRNGVGLIVPQYTISLFLIDENGNVVS